MVSTGDTAPDFTVPKAGGEAYDDVTEFTLSDSIGGGPLVLAFVPAAFTSGCTSELTAVRDRWADFEELEANVHAISVDLPFAQNIWIDRESLPFSLLSDWDHRVIHQYDVVRTDLYGSIESAQRSIFVIDNSGTITFRWLRTEEQVDYDRLVDSTLEAVEAAKTA